MINNRAPDRATFFSPSRVHRRRWHCCRTRRLCGRRSTGFQSFDSRPGQMSEIREVFISEPPCWPPCQLWWPGLRQSWTHQKSRQPGRRVFFIRARNDWRRNLQRQSRRHRQARGLRAHGQQSHQDLDSMFSMAAANTKIIPRSHAWV